jgi:hypothetical protein
MCQNSIELYAARRQSTEPLATLDPTTESRFLDRRLEEPVAYSLVIALGVVVMCQNSIELYAARR